MADTQNILFDDKNVKPTEEMVFYHIADKKVHWIELMNYIGDTYKDSEGTWNYYNDGKRWLYKHVLKKKTLFWLTVFQGAFRITFYFGDKAEPVILASNLSVRIKDEFMTGRRYGKIRGISVDVDSGEDLIQIKELMSIKSKLK